MATATASGEVRALLTSSELALELLFPADERTQRAFPKGDS